MPAFVWPTVQRAVSSGFTDRRRYGQHNAIDIPAPIGAPVFAIATGTVAFAGLAGSCGKAVFINHPDGWRSHYCHQSVLRVTAGRLVSQGQRIGDVLVTHKVVSPEQMAAALEAQSSMPMVRIGEALIALGFIKQDQLDDALKQQRKDRTVPLGEVRGDLVGGEVDLLGQAGRQLLGLR